MENETGVSKQGTAAEPAKTAENASAGASSSSSPAEAAAAAEETPVSFQPRVLAILDSSEGHAVLEKLIENFVGQWLFANPPTIGREQMEQLIDHAGLTANTTVQQAMTGYDLEVSRKIEAAKADILAHLTPQISAIVEGRPAPAIAARPAAARVAPVQILTPGDPVKVWGDPEHKTFRLGEVVAEHDAGHAYDVELDDGTVTKIGADGLELDTRK